jgi:hypothetical protein
MASLALNPTVVRPHLTTFFQTICDRPKLPDHVGLHRARQSSMGLFYRKWLSLWGPVELGDQSFTGVFRVGCFTVGWR